MFQKDRSGHCIEKGLAEGQGLKPGVYSQAGIAAILAGDTCGVDHGESCRGARSGWILICDLEVDGRERRVKVFGLNN